MTVWTERLSEAVLAARCAVLVQEGHLDGERSIMVHDLDRLTLRLQALLDAFPSSTLHGIAVKANPLVAVLEVVVQAGAGLECASIEEVELARAAGCPPARIIFDSPAKTREEIELALQLGLHLNVDNLSELARIAAHVDTHGPPAGHVGLRINPQVGAGSIAITSVAGRTSKFGEPLATQRAAIVDAFQRHPWLDGLHVHVGSQGCELGQLVDGVRTAAELRRELQKGRDAPITELDIGGGLPAAYRREDHPPELTAYVNALRADVPDLFDDDVRLLTEFGRSLQAGCGWAVSRVEYTKGEGEGRMAVVHLGADAFMRPVYQPKDWHHDLMVLDGQGHPKTGAPLEPISVVGPLCFGGDVLARDVRLPAIEAGDLIVIRDCGAYTLSMWSRHCSRGLPKVVGWREDERRVLKRREEPRDVVAFWSH
jgi:diaminopimelate decarboxylase